MDFETLWNTHERKVAKKMNFKKNAHKTALIAMVGVLVLSMGGFAASKIFKQDKVDYAFEAETQLIGEWESVDFVETPENYKPSDISYNDELFLKKLAFLPNGKMLCIDSDTGKQYVPSGLTYTKGHILQRSDKVDNAYEIKTFGPDIYLFMQWKSKDYTEGTITPSYYVFKQISTQDMTNYKPVVVRKDEVNLTFANDPQLVGNWKRVDFVFSIDQFKPGICSEPSQTYLIGLEMQADGNVGYLMENFNGLSTGDTYWTKGKIYEPANNCVESYEIKEMGGKTYLFFPWINGDVINGGATAPYYVLEKQ